MSKLIEAARQPDGSLHEGGSQFVRWKKGDSDITLDGDFTVQDIESIARHVRGSNTGARAYRIVPIGSGARPGWAIECDGVVFKTDPSLQVLGAYLDALLAGADQYDAVDIAAVIRRRPTPSYEERMAVFRPSGRPEPSRDPFAKGKKA